MFNLAFILFRQHNQAAVVAQNPSKPNPEISKIIGEMWRQCSQEIKDIWLKHADVCPEPHVRFLRLTRLSCRMRKGNTLSDTQSTDINPGETARKTLLPLQQRYRPPLLLVVLSRRPWKRPHAHSVVAARAHFLLRRHLPLQLRQCPKHLDCPCHHQTYGRLLQLVFRRDGGQVQKTMPRELA
jgi:hypothetical protein